MIRTTAQTEDDYGMEYLPEMGGEQTFRVEVTYRPAEVQTGSQALVKAAQQLGINNLHTCSIGRLFFLRGNLTPVEVKQLAETFLADPITETFAVIRQSSSQPGPDTQREAGSANPAASDTSTYLVDVTLIPGVTDPAAENLLQAAHMLGWTGLSQAATGHRYLLTGRLTEAELHRLAIEVFSNPVIQRVSLNRPISAPFFPYQQADETVDTIPLRQATDETLLKISDERRLALNLAEMRAIQSYYRQEQRDPTDVELEMLAQTWSEHCIHKTFKATIQYTGPIAGADAHALPTTQMINGLFRSCIRAATERVAKPWVRSTFVDNAGIIAFDDTWDLAFKAETHNHPSALEPFGGANTGVGGVVRDILGVSARPIANTDVLCFGPPNLPETELPQGVLHPRRVADGVIHGIEDYGNKMGIPTVNGTILYHPGYTANPLVYCGCLGLLPRNSHPTTPQPDDLIVVIGGRTGRDGLRGATFSSMEMDQTTGEIAGSAVQIGHPINEKQVMEVVLRARDEGLYHAITDCGAGGLSSAVGEMAQQLGTQVQLQAVPLKYPGLRPWEIWLSEAQERMVLAVPQDKWLRLQAICTGQDVEAVTIGHFTDTGRLHLFYGERQVGNLDLNFLHKGIPLGKLEAAWQPPDIPQMPISDVGTDPVDPAQALLTLLAHPNIRSKEPVIRRYDHEVQGATLIRPLVGMDNHGPGDATVLIPLDVQMHNVRRVQESEDESPRIFHRGVALSVGICPGYGELDPYTMAWAATDEAMRNLVAVGADPTQVALMDNFCWGNPNLPDRLGSLVRCAQGCHDAAVAYNAPFISGKDSLNNEYTGADGQRHAIPGTLLISAVGIVPDVAYTTTMDLKQAGNLLYIVGKTRPELGSSHYQQAVLGQPAHGLPPQPVDNALDHLRAVHQAISAGIVRACHDCSEGGLGVALAEMCLAGRLGAAIDLTSVPTADNPCAEAEFLFSESLSRFIIEVRSEDAQALEATLKDVPHARIGHVSPTSKLDIQSQNNPDYLLINLSELEMAWRGKVGQEGSDPAAQPSNIQASSPPKPVFAQSEHYVPLVAPSSGPRVLILHANGTNRDREAALACELAGASPEIVHINRLLAGERQMLDYHMLVVPGGFSYGDDLGAGTRWALDLRYRFGDDIARFVDSGRPVLGICNGFQVLVKSGLLPGIPASADPQRAVTLAPNHSNHFECRWVYLLPNQKSPSLFTTGLSELVYCPVAHSEGRLVVTPQETLTAIQTHNLDVVTYVNRDGSEATYPANPNGSVAGIAGLCNPTGNVLGLMPHPEDHIFPWQHPHRHRGETGGSGLWLFKNGIKHA